MFTTSMIGGTSAQTKERGSEVRSLRLALIIQGGSGTSGHVTGTMRQRAWSQLMANAERGWRGCRGIMSEQGSGGSFVTCRLHIMVCLMNPLDANALVLRFMQTLT